MWWGVALFGSAFGGTACAQVLLGVNLGLFLAGLLICVLLLPFVVASASTAQRQLFSGVCVIDGIATWWLLSACTHDQFTIGQWLLAYAVLGSFGLCLLGMMFILFPWRNLAGGGAMLLALLWLSAPVWLLHHLQTPRLLPWMQRIIEVHPVFALNSIFPQAIWTEQPFAYQFLVNLNQDVYYVMPPSPLLCILFHALISGLCCLRYWRASRATAPAELT